MLRQGPKDVNAAGAAAGRLPLQPTRRTLPIRVHILRPLQRRRAVAAARAGDHLQPALAAGVAVAGGLALRAALHALAAGRALLSVLALLAAPALDRLEVVSNALAEARVGARRLVAAAALLAPPAPSRELLAAGALTCTQTQVSRRDDFVRNGRARSTVPNGA